MSLFSSRGAAGFFHLRNAGDHNADLRREHLVAVMHQLAPLLHVAVRDRQNGEAALFRAAARRVARQHGQVGAVLEQLHDHARALQLQERTDCQLLVRQLHIELVAVAVGLRHEHERLIH